MIYSAPAIFDESAPIAWRIAAVFSLFAALLALNVSPEFSLINAGFSLSAVAISLLVSTKLPAGALAFWTTLIFGVWLSPLARDMSASAESMRVLFGIASILVSLVFQGKAYVFFVLLFACFGLSLPNLSRDLVAQPLNVILLDDSFQFLQGALVVASSIFFLRVSRSRTNALQNVLQTTTENLEKTRTRMSVATDAVQIARENMLGRALAHGEVIPDISSSPLDQMPSNSTSFDTLIAELRQAFAKFQVRGRENGNVAGPIRFVFFAPVVGYDEKSRISVDLEALVSGVNACLELALESLPEIGARKREGVIRLSIRYGLRVIEVSVEDNGRGLVARNLEAETKLGALKDLCVVWGGTFDRVARLGVGSRTTLELRILTEFRRGYRATLKHPIVEPTQSASAPHA